MNPIQPIDAETARRAGESLQQLIEQLEGVVIGQSTALHQLVVTLAAGGHALIEGVPGTAKTLSVMTLSSAVEARPGRIQFTPDLMPSDVTGVNVLDPRTNEFRFQPGPLFADVLLADEINRAPAKTQSALLEAMQESRATVDGERHDLGELFTVFATQNPIEFEGTYPLPEAQLDRFLMKIVVGYPERDDEVGLLARHAAGFDSARPETYGLERVLDRARVVELRGLARRVRVAPAVVEYVTDLVRATREDPALMVGASPRASVALLRAAQASALVAGRDFVVPDDVIDLALPVLRHRVLLSPEAEIDGASGDDRIRAAIADVPAPEVERGAPTAPNA
ncbi:MAG: MoxR family ATPase [Planctomycetota bacterium]